MRRFVGILVVVAMVFAFSSMAMGKKLLQDYNACEIQEFVVPSYVPAPGTSGAQLADDLVYQIRRYAQSYGLFDMVIKEGTAEVPAGKKTLLIKGEVREYTEPRPVKRRVMRRFVPGGEYTGTAYFAAHYQFVDKATGEVVYETDLRTSSTGSEDTVEYAMLRNAEAAAKVIYKLK